MGEIGPGPVEDELALAIELDVRRAAATMRSPAFTSYRDECRGSQPARSPTQPVSSEAREPGVPDEGRGVVTDERVPLLGGHVGDLSTTRSSRVTGPATIANQALATLPPRGGANRDVRGRCCGRSRSCLHRRCRR